MQCQNIWWFIQLDWKCTNCGCLALHIPYNTLCVSNSASLSIHQGNSWDKNVQNMILDVQHDPEAYSVLTVSSINMLFQYLLHKRKSRRRKKGEPAYICKGMQLNGCHWQLAPVTETHCLCRVWLVLIGAKELQRIQALNPERRKKRYVMERMTSGLIRRRGKSLV